MQDRPSIHELLAAVSRFLDEEIVPATQGRRQFLARVAANTLRIVDRELGTQERELYAEVQDWIRLFEVLQGTGGSGACEVDTSEMNLVGSASRDAEQARRWIRARNEDLSRQIQRGDFDQAGAGRAAVLEHVRRLVERKFAVTFGEETVVEASLPR
jgi:Domain of unknown function (DUF6285)